MKSKWCAPRWSVLVAVSGLIVAGCGSEGGGGVSTTIVDGVVVVGAPVAGARVTVKDTAGNTRTTTADSLGYYGFTSTDLAALKAPLLIQATGEAGGIPVTLHSLLEAMPASNAPKQVVNVTPATEAITAQTLQSDPATIFQDKAPASVDPAQLALAKDRLRQALREVLVALGQDVNTVDLMTTPFTANNTGLDKLFDLVSIQTSASSKTQRDVVVSEKKDGGQTVTIAANSSSTPDALPKPGAEAELNIATIKEFLPIFNRLIKSQEGIKSSEMLELFDPDFLDSGMDRSALIQDLLANALGKFQLTDLVINGCSSTAGGNICKGHMSSKALDTQEVETMAMTFKLGSDKKWRAYGNRAPFDFELKPVVFQKSVYNSPSDASPMTTQVSGINFWFTGRVRVNGVEEAVYKSAKLWSSNANGEPGSWNWVMTLKTAAPGSSCPAGIQFLPIDGGTASDCTNFKVIGDQKAIADGNAAQAKGLKKFKIEAFKSADATGEPDQTYVGYSNKQLFTLATGAQALEDSPVAAVASTLASSDVQFGSGSAVLESISIGVQKDGAKSNTSWNRVSQIKALAGHATTQAANKLCQGEPPVNSSIQASCEASYGTGAVIKRIHLSARDPQGRGVWKSYQLSGF